MYCILHSYIVHPESFRSNAQNAIAFARRNRPRVDRNDEFACVYLHSRALCTFFKKFVRRYYALFSKYGVSVRTHVHKGICIALVVKHELSRHITTSRGQC